MMMAGPVVGVVGAGFSGVLTAIHLLRCAPAVQVRLVERADRVGRGRAYSTRDPQHLLNVRARNMSAFPDAPDHFLRWLAEAGLDHDADAFVSRGLYGDYLQGLLRQALSGAGGGQFILEHDEATAVRPRPGGGYDLGLAIGRSLAVDAVVLALGAGGAPPQRGAAILDDPWAGDLEGLPGGDILLIGSGLTAVDVALTLDRPDRRIWMVSRRGLSPRPHAAAEPVTLAAEIATPSQALAAVRAAADRSGWRSAVDALRTVAPGLWARWSPAERRRFLRHLQPWWDVHRHRMAPAVAARFAEAVGAGRWRVEAGRVEAIVADGPGVVAHIRSRGAPPTQARRFAAAVNCTGFAAAPDDLPLAADLLRRGLAARDPLGLGLALDADFRLLDRTGQVQAGLYAIGPLARGAVWEATAVPDLRGHAWALARTVARDLARAPVGG